MVLLASKNLEYNLKVVFYWTHVQLYLKLSKALMNILIAVKQEVINDEIKIFTHFTMVSTISITTETCTASILFYWCSAMQTFIVFTMMDLWNTNQVYRFDLFNVYSVCEVLMFQCYWE